MDKLLRSEMLFQVTLKRIDPVLYRLINKKYNNNKLYKSITCKLYFY